MDGTGVLVQTARAKDAALAERHQAFTELVVRFQDMAFGCAFSRLGDWDLAEDAAQGAFVAAWQNLHQLRQPEAFAGWFRQIVARQCWLLTRGRQSEVVSLDSEERLISQEPDPYLTLVRRMEEQAVQQAVASLPEQERVVTILFHLHQYSQREISAFLEISIAAVKSRLRSARKRLQKQMTLRVEDELALHRPSREERFVMKVMTMIRPTDGELNGGGGTWSCEGADIWSMIEAARDGDVNRIGQLLDKNENLVRAEYWYTQPIHYAVREGRQDAVKLLLERGADPTHVRYGGEDLLIVARDRGHERVAQLLEQARREMLGSAPEAHEIHLAVRTKEMARVHALIRETPELVSRRDPEGRTPLHHAVAAGSAELVEFLLDHGAEIDAVSGSGGTYDGAGFRPLDYVFWSNSFWSPSLANVRLAEILIARGAEYAITIAAALGDSRRVEQLLDAIPQSVNEARPNGRRPLSAAIQFGHFDLAKLLLEKGADPALPEGRYTPAGASLYYAAKQNHHELVRLLLEKGADPNSGIDSGGNGWHVGDEETRQLLYQYGFNSPDFEPQKVEALEQWADRDPVGLSHTGCGGIFASVLSEREYSDEEKHRVMMMLLQKGVRVPDVVTGCRGYLWGTPRFTRVLLEHGMNPNLPNFQRVTPLHEFCARHRRGEPHPHRIELAHLFLDFGADINARDEEYRSTPLGWAARNGLKEMVELLLSRGAKNTLPDDEPWATPLSWAERRGHSEIADLLRH